MAGPFDSAADEIDARGAIYDRRLAGRLLRFLAPYKKEVAFSVVLLAVISLLEVAGPYLTKVAIDTYVKPASGQGVLPADASRGLLIIALAYIGVLAAAFGLRYFQSYMMSMVGQRAMRDLRLNIFRHPARRQPHGADKRAFKDADLFVAPRLLRPRRDRRLRPAERRRHCHHHRECDR